MPPGIGYGNPQMAAQAMMAQGGQPAPMEHGGGDNPLAALLALLGGQQGQEQAPPEFPQPRPISRAEVIGAIIRGALGDQGGPNALMRRHNQALQSQQAQVVQERLFSQSQGSQRNALMNTLLDHMAAQAREGGLEQRFGARLDEAGRLQTERLSAAERLAADREAGLNARFDRLENRKAGEFSREFGLKELRLELDRERAANTKAFQDAIKEMRTTGRPLPAAEASEFSDMASGVNQARFALKSFIDLGKPGTEIGAGLIPMRLRSKNFKDWAALWTSVRAPIRKAFSGVATTEQERKDVSDLLVQIGTDPGSTEAALNAIIQMLDSKAQTRVRGLELSGFAVDPLRALLAVPADPNAPEAGMPTLNDLDLGGDK